MKKLIITALIVGLPLLPLAVLAAAKTSPGQTNMVPKKEEIPSQYLILPVPQGDLKEAKGENTLLDATVKDENGKDIGTVAHMIMDTKTGKIAYAAIELADTKRFVAVPWSNLKVNRTNGKVWLNGEAKDLRPDINPKMAGDQSPKMTKLIKEVEEFREVYEHADRSGLGVTNRPAAAGSMGETETGGAGPSGPRGMPPGK